MRDTYKNVQGRKNANHPNIYEEQNGLSSCGIYKNEWTAVASINTDDALKLMVSKCTS